MGIDYGIKRIGVAFADEDTRIATPHDIIKNDDDVINRLSELSKEREVRTIVLGESKNLSGDDNPVMEQIRSFKQALESAVKIPVVYVPEFFTSAQARRQPEAKQNVDGSAAAIILQSYLDSSIYGKNN